MKKVFKKILIANRGEIAIRVIRACRDLGIQSVAVFSEADRDSLHVILADEAYYIGPAPSKESYLNYEKIIEVCKKSGAEAVHPGYGFLSENSDFAARLKEENIIFIGPNSECIDIMGDKIQAKKTMQKAGVPTVPGSDGPVNDVEAAKKVAKQVGYPILIKASAGGGGKGMRLVTKEEEIASAFRAAQNEARNFFADDTVYIERYIQSPKHIEIQVFGDQHGNVVHLFDRECSIQRRHQKIIEESPSPSISNEIREKMGEISVKAAKAIGYYSAGTFEFILDNVTKEFFFMEMNTRLQVEHPVTEFVTGRDLVQEQIFVACGHKLSFKQEEVVQRGHAIEARICAEDPVTFAPNPGRIHRCRHPQGPFVRLDSYAYPDYTVPIHYDPMVSKLIAWGDTRDQAIQRLNRALDEFTLTGIKTNIPLHKTILEHKKFLDGSYTTQFIEKDFGDLRDMFSLVDDRVFLISAAIEAYNQYKNRGSWKHNQLPSKWRDSGRQKALRS